MEGKNQQTHWIFWVMAVIAACLATGLVVYNNTDKIDQFYGYKQPIESQTTTVENTVTEEQSIAEILQWRDYLKEQKRVDSVYLTIPDVVLIDILIQHGTSISGQDIVYIYEAYPEIYNLIKSGARAQRYADSLRVKEPDKLPNQPRKDTLDANIINIFSNN